MAAHAQPHLDNLLSANVQKSLTRAVARCLVPWEPASEAQNDVVTRAAAVSAVAHVPGHPLKGVSLTIQVR